MAEIDIIDRKGKQYAVLRNKNGRFARGTWRVKRNKKKDEEDNED